MEPNQDKITKSFISSLLELKKEKKETSDEQLTLFFFIGLTLSLIVSIIILNWKVTNSNEILDLGVVKEDFDEIIDIPITDQPPPPPPVVQKLVSPKIVEVPDNEIEDIEEELQIDIEDDGRDIAQDVLITQQEPEEEIEEIFNIVEDKPEPKGGMESFYAFLGENIQYPTMAKRLGVEGMVFLRFVVEKDGNITDVQVLKGIGAGCDEEAMRVLKNAPRWTPGKQRGKPVRAYMSMPIRFTLAKKKATKR